MTNGQAQGIPGIVLSPQSATNIQPPPIIQQEFLKWLSTPEDVFIWIEHNLRGDTLQGQDENGNDVWKPNEIYRQMSEQGIQQTISKLRWYVNKFNFHADYDEDEIRSIMIEIAKDFHLWFMTKWREFQVKPSDFYSGIIADGIINMIYSAYKMAGLKKFYTNILSINNPGQQPQEQPSKKVLGIIPWPF